MSAATSAGERRRHRLVADHGRRGAFTGPANAARPVSNCSIPAAPPFPEEAVISGQAKQVFLTSHRPVRIADRNFLLSSSADITEQKAFEDQLFRSAYYDELTDLPTRRVIEHRANGLLQRDDGRRPFRAGVSRHR